MKMQIKYLEPITKASIKLVLAVSAIASFSAVLPNTAEAAHFKFSGRVTEYEFNNGITQDGSVVLNTLVTGEYRFDCLPTSQCVQQSGTYYDPLPNSGATVEIGNYEFQSVPYEGFGPAPTSMEYNMIFTSFNNWLTIGIEENNTSLDMNRLHPAGGSYSAISMSSSDPFSLGTLTVSSSQGMFQDNPDVWIAVEVTGIEKVPEPTSVLSLLAFGCLGIASKLRKSNLRSPKKAIAFSM